LISFKIILFLYFNCRIKINFGINNIKTLKMKKISFTLSVCTLLLIHNLSYAQTEDPGDIQPDRPGLGESSQIVPLKYFQIEAGGNYQWDKSSDSSTLLNVTYNSTFFRIGIFKNVELRLSFGARQDFAKWGSTSTSTNIGFMPWGLGFKAKLCEQKGLIPRTAFLGSLQIPYPSAKFLKTDHIAPYFLLPMEWDLNSNLLMTGNIGTFWNGNDANPAYFASLGYDYALPKGFGVFIEAYATIDDDAVFMPAINAGLVWLLKPNLKLDVSAGLGLNKTAPDGFINGGISYRLPK
jgi:hypothetical protein